MLFRSKLNTVHIPFKGAGPAIIGIIGNEAQIGMLSAVPVIPHFKSGKLRVLGITTAKRSATLPDIPAIGETVPGFDTEPWAGMFVPAGTPYPDETYQSDHVLEVGGERFLLHHAKARPGQITYGSTGEGWRWCALLGTFAVAYLALGMLLFEPLLEDS